MSQNTPPTIYCGLDIAKPNLQLDLLGRAYELPNTPAGHRRLRQLLAPQATAHVVCEATGGYERPVVAALHAAAIPVSVVNPGWVRSFAKAQGIRAKTDAIDAQVLSAYGRALHPQATPERSATEQHLTELIRRRNQLTDALVAERLKATGLTLPVLQRQAKSLVRRLEKDIAQVEALLAKLRQASPELEAKTAKLQAVVGVGQITALSVLAECPELGTLNRRQVAALAGLAPHPRESGTWKGHRKTGGGRPAVRRALYMAALVAARSNRHLKAFYQRLKSAGKASKVALTAVMRKLIVLMNHILKNPNFVLQN